MTMFWLYQIRSAILDYRNHRKLGELPGPDSFHEVLLHSPFLMYGGIWKRYYTKGIMFSPFAREHWRIPDIQPLDHSPTTTTVKTVNKPAQNRPDRLPRFAFGVVKEYLTTGERRGAVVARALDALRSSTMRQRASDSSIPPYSETQAYFWIQLSHAACAGLPPSDSFNISKLSYESFQILFEIDPESWKKYYTPKLWDSAQARMQYVNSDRKPLPNVIGGITADRIQRVVNLRATSSEADSVHQLPSLESLAFRAHMIRDEAKVIETPEANPITTHAHLLLNLYLRFFKTELEGDHGQSQSMGTHMTAAIAKLEGPTLTSFTSKVFWIQQIVASAVQMPPEHRTKYNGNIEGFIEFLAANLHLAYPNLPFVYYSKERWESYEAKIAFVSPDLKALPRFFGQNQEE